MQKFFTSFISGIIAIFFLHSTQYFWMMLGLPSFLAAAIAWILVIEIITKLMLLKAVPPFVVNQTSLEAHSHLNLDTELFDYYCSELEAIGFEKLTDYTSPSIKGMARLFYYPQHNCYAEVGMLAGFSAICSIVSGFEQDWFFAATNNNMSTNMKAISHVFLSLPRIMHKTFNEEPRILFNSFLSWQSEIKQNLSVEVIAVTDEEMYFAWERGRRKIQRQRLSRKSVIVSLIKMLLFSLNPKSEWMGDYKKSVV